MTTILLVEDAHDLAQVIIRELEANGYRALHAGDGLTALELHAKVQPELVILDWMLPKLSGLEVLRRLRQASSTPVLMLTARGEETDRVVGLELGADDYLTKPFSMRELLARVRAVLRRAELVQQVLVTDHTDASDTLNIWFSQPGRSGSQGIAGWHTPRSQPDGVCPAAFAAAQSGARVQPGLSARYRLGRDLCRRRPIS